VNGALIKSWEVHCFLCERPLLGVGRFGSSNDAAADARAEGWRTRLGMWVCGECAADPQCRGHVHSRLHPNLNEESQTNGS